MITFALAKGVGGSEDTVPALGHMEVEFRNRMNRGVWGRQAL